MSDAAAYSLANLVHPKIEQDHNQLTISARLSEPNRIGYPFGKEPRHGKVC